MNTKFQALHKESGKYYYFDLMWGENASFGRGWIGVLPIGVKLERIGGINVKDNRIPLEPSECEFSSFNKEER